MQNYHRCFLHYKSFDKFIRMSLCSNAGTAEYVKRAQMFDYWQRCTDDIIEKQFEHSKLVLMIDKRVAIQQQNIDTQTPPKFRIFDCKELREILKPYGIEIGTLNSALLDIWGAGNDSNNYIALFGTSLRLEEPPPESGIPENEYRNELASSLGVRLLDLRYGMLTLEKPKEREWLAKFQSIMRWFWTYQHCPTCTNPLKHKASKSSARCIHCEREYYPTISPVVITLIGDETNEYALLVRHNRSPNQVFTCIAGFCMLGEELEQTVQREVAEEVGIYCWDVKQLGGSQSWPIPGSSLMIPFMATANRNDQLQTNIAELEYANWFSRKEIRQVIKQMESDHILKGLKQSKTTGNAEINNTLNYIPPPGAIAHRLIRNWAFEGNSKV